MSRHDGKNMTLKKRNDGTSVLIDEKGYVRATYFDGCDYCESEKAKKSWFL